MSKIGSNLGRSNIQAAEQLEPGYRLLKVDTEADQAIAMKVPIRLLPTLAIFRNGAEVARQTSALAISLFIDRARYVN